MTHESVVIPSCYFFLQSRHVIFPHLGCARFAYAKYCDRLYTISDDTNFILSCDSDVVSLFNDTPLRLGHDFFHEPEDLPVELLFDTDTVTYRESSAYDTKYVMAHVRTRIRVIDYAKIESLYKTIGCGYCYVSEFTKWKCSEDVVIRNNTSIGSGDAKNESDSQDG